jgi:hypothetical protein
MNSSSQSAGAKTNPHPGHLSVEIVVGTTFKEVSSDPTEDVLLKVTRRGVT